MVISKTIFLPFAIIRADTVRKRLIKPLSQKGPLVEKGLHLIPCNFTHMFFKWNPVDVVFLDKSNRVVKTVSYLKPWRVILPVKNAHSTLELPVGTVKAEKIRVGDTIGFKV